MDTQQFDHKLGYVKVKVAQSCSPPHDPTDYTVHEILQAKILEWVDVPFSRGSSPPRNWTQISYTAGGFFTSWTSREATSGNGYPFQYFGLENSMDSSTWGRKESDTMEWLPLSACHVCKVSILLLKWKHSPPPAKTVYIQCLIIPIFSLLTYLKY